MPVNKCRVCQSDLFKAPLLRFENMPKAAQYMPDERSLASDTGVNLGVGQCAICGLVQLTNEPVPYFREVIRATAVSKEMTDFRMTQFQALITKYSLEKKKIIEIGCGKGEFISIFENFDIDVYGLEFSRASVRYCQNKGLKVEERFIDKPDAVLASAPFDAFYILNFLEHLPDPNTVLSGIRHNLSDGAIGLVEVPNFDMLLRRHLFSEFIGDHLFYFTKETLTATLNRNGYEVIDCREIWHDYILSAIVRKRQPLNISIFQQYQDRIKKEIKQYIARFGSRQVAIWGAGHQALAVIALTHISQQIRYVVDSAPFKQGKFTPASHIPIVPPEQLNTDPVEAVIIMAASYSDEVAGILRNRYGRDVHTAILRDFGLEEVPARTSRPTHVIENDT